MEVCTRGHLLILDEDWVYTIDSSGRQRKRCKDCHRQSARYSAKAQQLARANRAAACPRGHEFTDSTSRWLVNADGQKYRMCLPCQLIDNRRAIKRQGPDTGKPRREPSPEERAKKVKMLKDRRQRYRDLTQAHYGDVCSRCGNGGELGFSMHLDHVNEDGFSHRQYLRDTGACYNPAGWHFYKYLVEAGFPTDYELALLCESCHTSKGEWFEGTNTREGLRG